MSQPHVAVLAPPWYPVPPDGYGGIELVVHLLAQDLRRRGWRVSLFAAEGSAPETIITAPRSWSSDLGGAAERLRELTHGARVVGHLRRHPAPDVIHDHVGFGTLLAAGLAGLAPVLHTVHGPVDDAQAGFLDSLQGQVSLVAISDSQRAGCPRLPWLATIHNAVDMRQLLTARADEKEGYLLCLARVCPDKGQHLAIEVARRLGKRLVLAGKVEATAGSRTYFESHVRPFIDGDRVRHLHNVSGAAKALLLARASALLAPIQWDEPFGLSVVEAMASGTPAISMSRGAAPELIVPGVTGHLVENVDQMVDAVRRCEHIDPLQCALVTRRRFSPEAMAEGYVTVYEQLREGRVHGLPEERRVAPALGWTIRGPVAGAAPAVRSHPVARARSVRRSPPPAPAPPARGLWPAWSTRRSPPAPSTRPR